MADLGITIAAKLIEVTGSAIIKEICDMWGYKSQLADLNETFTTINNVLLDADSKRELSHETRSYIDQLKAAVYDADDLFDEFFTVAEMKLLDVSNDGKFLNKVRNFFSTKKGVSNAHRMSRQVKDIRKKLDEIVSNHQKFGLSVDYNPIVRRREDTCSYMGAQAIIGREHDKKVVIDMLLGTNDVDESIRFVSIVGVGGLGKTALAQLVCNDKAVEAEFPDPKMRLWVCVSDQDGEKFDVRSILCKILELVTDSKPDTTSPMECVQKKFQEQLKGRKYLLVLDDVWNEDCEKWRSLHKFLSLGQKGSRIVVTTRSEMTAKIVEEKYVHKLQGLSPGNSWLLFESIAFDKGEQELVNHLELVDIVKKIVEKCYNIPLAIKVVGSLLFGQPLSKWQTFVNCGMVDIGQGDNEIMSILKLSYHNLRPSLKNCFSYCALFPKDAYIYRLDLINLWMAQGYIVPLDRGQSMEDAAEEHFLILVRRCFFQNVKKDRYGDIKSVKIHDLMHDVALEVGREEIGVVGCNTTKLGDKVRHVYFVGDKYPQSLFLKSKIRSIISNSDPSYSRSLVHTPIDSWICLRVLYLQSTSMARLPDSIGKLLHLRYLDLSSNYYLMTLTDSITKLNNLQTLVLNKCNSLRELPKDFCKLVKLRHLNLKGCDRLSSLPSGIDTLASLRHLNLGGCELSGMPSGMGKLTNLRVLSLFVVGKEKRDSTEEQCMGELRDLKALTNLKNGIRIEIGNNYKNDGEGEYLKSMKHLSRVEICFYLDEDRYSECDGVMEKLEPSSNIKEIFLCRHMGTEIRRWGRAEDDWAISFQHLVNITINCCTELEQLPLLSKLHYLKSLSFSQLEKLEYMENRSNNMGNDGEELTIFFPSLESLQIEYLGSLKGWCRGEEYMVEKDDDHILRSRLTFPRLSTLEIIGCDNLTSFPSCPSVKDLNFRWRNSELQINFNEVDCDGNSQNEVIFKVVELNDMGFLKFIELICPISLELEQVLQSRISSLQSFQNIKNLALPACEAVKLFLESTDEETLSMLLTLQDTKHPKY